MPQLLPRPVALTQGPRLGCAACAVSLAASSPVTVFTTRAAAAGSMLTSKLEKLFLAMPSPPSEAPWQPINMTGEPLGPLALESLFSQGRAKDPRVVSFFPYLFILFFFKSLYLLVSFSPSFLIVVTDYKNIRLPRRLACCAAGPATQ
jgi:hypothetical protein